MAVEGQAQTAPEYIVHHLTHRSTAPQSGFIDFSVFNVDTIFFSIATLAITLGVLWLASRRATSGVPGRFQAFMEDAGRDGRGTEQVDRPWRPPLHRAARAYGFHLDLS
jgi:F0F1-type ATP synthase membrane subunit a